MRMEAKADESKVRKRKHIFGYGAPFVFTVPFEVAIAFMFGS